MVISNETRNREGLFSRNCIMEKSCFRYFKIYIIKFHYYNTEKINRKNKRPQAKCPPTCEMSVCGEYVCNMYVKK